MSRLNALATSEVLAPIDLRFADLLARKAGPKTAGTIALTAALVSRERGLGHSCVDLDDWAGRRFPAEGKGKGKDSILPEKREWIASLRKAPGLVGDGSRLTPLVLDEGGRVYLYRYWSAEQRLAKAILDRLGPADEEEGWDRVETLFPRLFPPTPDLSVDWQAVAATSALHHRFTIVTGGPGTGKTTTVARILALLLAGDPEAPVALAAPTGKGSARLTESVLSEAEKLPLEAGLLERIRRLKAGTLHRLLGYNPRLDAFRYHAGRRLPEKTLIVDEASMVDLLLMDSLFQAVSPQARVILLGDKDQLASVETGYVLGDLCRAAELDTNHGPGFAAFFKRLSRRKLPAARKKTHPLRDGVVELQKNYRFPDHPGIGSLAQAINAGKQEKTIEILTGSEFGDVTLSAHPERSMDILSPVVPQLNACEKASSPAEALERLKTFRILCATRFGRWSVDHLNKVVEARLRERGRDLRSNWYRGRPLMVTENDYHVRLFNGDVGVCWPKEGTTFAWFPGEEKEPRPVPLSKLPAHETAWAMTIHKAQGSEFDHVLLVLPDGAIPILSRELLYTGVTRARNRVEISALEEVVRKAVSHTAVRKSGLVDAFKQNA